MAFDLGSFRARLGIDTSGYASGILSANTLSEVFGQTFATFVTNPVLGAISAFANLGRSLKSTASDLLATSEELQRMSQRTGVTVETIQALTAKMEQAGFQARLAGRGIQNLAIRSGQARAGATGLRDAFESLGISIDNVTDNEELFRLVIDRIDQLGDASSKAAVAAQLIGEQAGPRLINALGGGEAALNQLIDDMTQLGLVADKASNDQLANFNTTLGITQQALEGVVLNTVREFLVGLIGEVGTADSQLVSLAGTLNSRIGPAARGLGQQIGELVGNLDRLIDRLNSVFDFFDRIESGRDSAIQGLADALTPILRGVDAITAPITIDPATIKRSVGPVRRL